MRRIIEAVIESSNLIFMIREGETDKMLLGRKADQVMAHLENAIDAIAIMKEERNADRTLDACNGKGCCNNLQCDKIGRGTPA